MSTRILIVDDEPNITSSFSSLLNDEGYHTETAGNAEQALKLCSRTDFALILLDLNLPGISGIEFLKALSEEPLASMVLVISGQSDIPVALEAIRLGAIDYIEKPVPPQKLISSVRAALMLAEANRQRSLLVEEIDRQSQIAGKSRAVKKLLATIDRAAPSDATILICGENGTGKELVATRLFLQSLRREKPFIKVNCPGIPETLFESELFGHKRGAFTGAVKDYPGKFVLADRGTIFLDEIGDLPLECQAKLLRVLESGEVETLGATEKRQVDVRLICASNRDLPSLVADRKFREDLYYRISVLPIMVPPLRERLDDVPILVGEFQKRFDPADTTSLSPEAMAYLTTLDYPGNVRQLKNMVERWTIMCHGRTVTVEDLEHRFPDLPLPDRTPAGERSLAEKVAAFEKHLIRSALAKCRGNISETARTLGIDRANLSRKIKDLGLKD